MKISVLILTGAIGFWGLTGCATAPPQPTKLDYGAPLTIDYQDVIKKKFARIVKNSDAITYSFSPPEEYWYKPSPVIGGKMIAGYAVPVGVDAPNSLGGMTGPQPYIFIFRDNQLVKTLTPEDIGSTKNY